MGNLKARLWTGALYGIEVMLWYAAAEYLLLVSGLVIRSHSLMMLPQWRGTVLLCCADAVLGAVGGTLVALLVRDPDHVRKILIILVAAAFGINAGVAVGLPLASRSVLIVAAISIVIAVCMELRGIGLLQGVAKRPELLFVLLVSLAWPMSNSRLGYLAPGPRAAAGCVIVALVIAGILVVNRLLTQPSAHLVRLYAAVRHGARLAAVVLLCVCPAIFSSRAGDSSPTWTDSSSAKSARPNVILVTLDTVRADHMGVYDYARANTPHLRALLKEATLYTKFIAAAPMTLTSHASIFTGLYPQSHGSFKRFNSYRYGAPLSENIPTMAQLMSAKGYQTMAVVANKYYLGFDFAVLRGFQFVDWAAPMPVISENRDYLLRNRVRSLLRISGVVRDLDSTSLPAEEVNRKAIALLDDCRQRNSSFFLFLNYMDAHVPYIPPAPYCDLYPGRDLGFSNPEYVRAGVAVDDEDRPVDPRVRQHLLSQYDGGIAYLDEKLGELIEHLKQNGQFDRTMIIVTSDHGETFGSRNLLGHDASVYQDEVHVPLLVKYPEQTTPARVEALASHVDLMPTVLDVAAVPLPGGLQGIDLRNVAAAPDRTVVAEMHGSLSHSGARFNVIKFAVYSGSMKMIYSTNGQRELYDLANDPSELHNLFRPDTPPVLAMRKRLVEWSRGTTPRYLTDRPMDLDTLERLKSLGYAHQGID